MLQERRLLVITFTQPLLWFQRFHNLHCLNFQQNKTMKPLSHTRCLPLKIEAMDFETRWAKIKIYFDWKPREYNICI